MKGMSGALNFGKSVHDNGWGMFVAMLQYKAMFLGKQVKKIDRDLNASINIREVGRNLLAY